MYVTALWLATLALGGTPVAAGHAMARYPLASAAVTALLLYALSVVGTDDRRIGLAAILAAVACTKTGCAIAELIAPPELPEDREK